MPSPTAAIRPQPSWPGAPAGCGYSNHVRPSHTGMLDAHTPEPSSFTSTCPAPGSGTSMTRTVAEPGEAITLARMRRSPDDCGVDRCASSARPLYAGQDFGTTLLRV